MAEALVLDRLDEIFEHLSHKDLERLLHGLCESSDEARQKATTLLATAERPDVSDVTIIDPTDDTIDAFVSSLDPLVARAMAFFHAGLFHQAVELLLYLLDEFACDFADFRAAWQGKPFALKLDATLSEVLRDGGLAALSGTQVGIAKSRLEKCQADLSKFAMELESLKLFNSE